MYKIIQLAKKADYRGALIPIEQFKEIPFEIKRVYYMFDTLPDVVRGKHSHKNLEQLLICLNGSCKVLLDDGEKRKIIILDNKSEGLYIGCNIWREVYDFTKETVLMVIASDYYIESDYIRSYDDFLSSISERK